MSEGLKTKALENMNYNHLFEKEISKKSEENQILKNELEGKAAENTKLRLKIERKSEKYSILLKINNHLLADLYKASKDKKALILELYEKKILQTSKVLTFTNNS